MTVSEVTARAGSAQPSTRNGASRSGEDSRSGVEGLHLDIAVDRHPHVVNASLAVAPGERLALFGPSGAGKTTILEVVAGITRVDRGLVRLFGRVLSSSSPRVSVPLAERRVGLLRQPPGLFPHLTVAQNAAYGRPGGLDDEAVAVLDELGLDRHRTDLPIGLSGGQRQRVALARVLLGDHQVLLLDEPFSGLDAAVRGRAGECVRTRSSARGVPVVLVTHDLPEAQAFAHRMGIMDCGTLLQLGDPHDVVAHPATRRVAELVGYRGFVPAAVAGGGSGVYCIHPHRVVLGAHPDAGPVLEAQVVAVRPAGPSFEADLVVADRFSLTCVLSTQQPGRGGGGEPASGMVGATLGAMVPPEGRAGAGRGVAEEIVGRTVTVTALEPPRVADAGDEDG